MTTFRRNLGVVQQSTPEEKRYGETESLNLEATTLTTHPKITSPRAETYKEWVLRAQQQRNER